MRLPSDVDSKNRYITNLINMLRENDDKNGKQKKKEFKNKR